MDVLSRLGELSSERLSQLLEGALSTAGNARTVTLDLTAGVLQADLGLLALPLPGWRVLEEQNGALAGERLVVATARNTGVLQASVETFTLQYRLAGATLPDGRPAELTRANSPWEERFSGTQPAVAHNHR